MPSFKTFLLPIALLVATSSAATCSGDWSSNTFDGDTKCCYGNMLVDGRDAYCCVYDLIPPVETSSASAATTTSDDYDSWSTSGECFTKIPFSASNYSDLVSSASSKIAATRATVATNEATSTSTSVATNEATSTSTSASSASSGTTSAASNTGSQTSSGSAAVTSNAAMSIATAQEIILGGAAVVVGLFML